MALLSLGLRRSSTTNVTGSPALIFLTAPHPRMALALHSNHPRFSQFAPVLKRPRHRRSPRRQLRKEQRHPRSTSQNHLLFSMQGEFRKHKLVYSRYCLWFQCIWYRENIRTPLYLMIIGALGDVSENSGYSDNRFAGFVDDYNVLFKLNVNFPEYLTWVLQYMGDCRCSKWEKAYGWLSRIWI